VWRRAPFEHLATSSRSGFKVRTTRVATERSVRSLNLDRETSCKQCTPTYICTASASSECLSNRYDGGTGGQQFLNTFGSSDHDYSLSMDVTTSPRYVFACRTSRFYSHAATQHKITPHHQHDSTPQGHLHTTSANIHAFSHFVLSVDTNAMQLW